MNGDARFKALMIVVTLSVLLLGAKGFVLCSSLYAADGDLDPTFGTGGKVTTDFVGGQDRGHSVALQADGKIVVVGLAWTDFGYDFAVARYSRDGSLDSTFGTGGKVTTDFGSSTDYARGVAVQADGKIVVVGDFEFSDFTLARYNPDGTLDMSFGTGGKVTTPMGSYTRGISVALQDDGKIVVAGHADSDFALARYIPDGSLDMSFGTGGKVTTDFGGGEDLGSSVALQADGKIVAAGRAGIADPADFALARYNPDGSLDASFGIGGMVTTNISDQESIASLALQDDGKIVAAGNTLLDSGLDCALARYNPDGSLDASFGIGGMVITDFADGGKNGAGTVALQADGKIVIAGSNYLPGTDDYADFALARYNPDGSLDASFGTDGKVTTDFGGPFEHAAAVVLQADGKIVAVGRIGRAEEGGRTEDFALARYLVSPSMELSVRSAEVKWWKKHHAIGRVHMCANFTAPMPEGEDIVRVTFDGILLFSEPFAAFHHLGRTDSYVLRKGCTLIHLDFNKGRLFVRVPKIILKGLNPKNGVDVQVLIGTNGGAENIRMVCAPGHRLVYRRACMKDEP